MTLFRNSFMQLSNVIEDNGLQDDMQLFIWNKMKYCQLLLLFQFAYSQVFT